MKIHFEKSVFVKNLFITAFLMIFISCACPFADAQKVYVDITSPGMRKLPIAIQPFSGGREISDIVREDLDFTGLFYSIDEKAQIEKPDQPFNKANWKGLQAEVVVKGRVIKDKKMNVLISVYDVSEGREVLKKEYSASQELYRPLAHSISNDVYKILTEQQGIFRTKIAFTGEKSRSRELFLMDWDGYRANEIGIKADILLTPRWAANGSKLIYSKQRNRQWGIFLLDMNTMKESNVVVLKGLSMSGNFLPGSREFVFVSSKDGNSDIYIGDIGSAKSRKLVSSQWIDVSPSASPDGKKLLFVSNRAGNPQIYVSDINGNDPKRITFEGLYNTAPTWSPKGDKIAFAGMTGGRHQIFIMKTDGSGLTQLTTAGNNEEPSFSPDGRFIAFTSDRDGIKGIYIMRADGENQKRITAKSFKATSPSWSPL